jgi:carbonic anhydrase
MRFKPIIVDLFSSSLHQVHGNDKLYPLEIHVTHEDKEGNRIVLVILYETA